MTQQKPKHSNKKTIQSVHQRKQPPRTTMPRKKSKDKGATEGASAGTSAKFTPRPSASLITSKPNPQDEESSTTATLRPRTKSTSQDLDRIMSSPDPSQSQDSSTDTQAAAVNTVEAEDIDDYIVKLVAYISSSSDCELTLEEVLRLFTYVCQVDNDALTELARNEEAPLVPAMCSAMLRAIDMIDALEWAASALWRLAEDSGRAFLLVQCQVPKALLQVLSKHPISQPTTKLYAFTVGALAAIACQVPECQDDYLAEDVPTPVLRTMKAVLSGKIGGRGRESKTGKGQDKKLKRKEVTSQLVIEDEFALEALKWCASIIASLTDGHAANRIALLHLDTHVAILQCLECTADDGLQASFNQMIDIATLALSELTQHTETAAKVIDTQAWPVLLRLVEDYLEDADVVKHCVLILNSLVRACSTTDAELTKEEMDRIATAMDSCLQTHTEPAITIYARDTLSLCAPSVVQRWTNWTRMYASVLYNMGTPS
eukprot:m.89342 g.89342  ORF g.89342 m.89342 type:complete len:488 (+) comp12892_c0_seq1:1446-2909(+)